MPTPPAAPTPFCTCACALTALPAPGDAHRACPIGRRPPIILHDKHSHKLAISKAAALSEAAQEQLGRELLERIDTLAKLRAEIEIGISDLDAVEGEPLDVEDVIREACKENAGGQASRLGACRSVGPQIASGENPLAWRARDEVRAGLRSVLAHPYMIFYRVRDDTAEIVRILHERRDFSAAFSKDKG